jgi:hypothetical protein
MTVEIFAGLCAYAALILLFFAYKDELFDNED